MKRERFFHKVIQIMLVSGMLVSTAACGRESVGQNPCGEGSPDMTEDLGEAAVLVQDEREIEIRGNVLIYGGLIVEQPEGIEARLIDAEDNGNIFNTGNFLSEGSKGRIVDLCGAQEVYADRVGGDGIKVYLDLPPRVRLLHYRASYDSEMALLCAFFDLLPDAVGNRMYENPAKREYAYRLQQDGYLHLFLVRGEEIYLVQEIAEEENSFLFVCERWKYGTGLWLYREGYFEAPCQEIHGDFRDDLEDVNFDGCPDIIGYDEVYLWSRQKRVYEQAKVEVPLYYLRNRRFPETASIWSVTTDRHPESWEPTSESEAIWQWEGNTLVKKRECTVSIVDNSRRVWAYEDTPNQLLFDETFSLDEWEQEEQGRVRLLYEQFYDGIG